MKKILFGLLFLFFVVNSQAQCLEIESILVDACVPGTGCTTSASPSCSCEGKNEMVRFQVGANNLQVSDLSVIWPNNSFLGWCQDATTAGIISTLNATIGNNCGWLQEPVGGILPANASVLIITSTEMCTSANSFYGLNDTMYVIFQCAGNFQGHFANYNATPGIRDLIITNSGANPCSDTVSYDRSLLVNINGTTGGSSGDLDGSSVAYDPAGNPTYYNNGCQAPITVTSAAWSFTDKICNTYGAVNLNTLLASNATLGGTWAGTNVVDSIYTPNALGVDSVTYSVAGTSACSASLDSTIVFQVVEVQEGTLNLQSCDSLLYNGTMYYASTTVTSIITNSNPYYCDSSVLVNIVINDAYVDSAYLSACDSVLHAGSYYFSDTIIRDTILGGGGGSSIDTILHTSFEDSEGWTDHATGNWSQIDAYGTWSGSGMYANVGSTHTGGRKIGMNDVGDFIQLPPVDNPTSFTYFDELSSAPSSTNAFALQYWDGTMWVEIGIDTCTHTTYESVTFDVSFLSGLTGVEFRIYRTSDNRSGYIDDITIFGQTSATSSCDSISITNIVVLQSDSTFSTSMSCNAADTGYVTSSYTNQTGCDSLHTVYTALSNLNSASDSAYICNGDSAFLEGAYQTTAGIYYDTLYATGSSTLDTFYMETFDGAASWTLNTPTGTNGADNNFWVINSNEAGVAPNGCGTSGGTDLTLHVTSVFNPSGGAAYDAGGLCGLLFCPQTNMATTSVNISTIGKTNLTLGFDFIGNGDALNDNASLLYSINGGTSFVSLDPSLKSPVCVGGQGQWTYASYTLPAAAENISNLQIRFNWTNNDDGVGTDPSVAINNVYLTSATSALACDTVLATQLFVYNTDSTYSTDTVCNPNNTGSFDTTYTNTNGCDSVHTTVAYFYPDTFYLNGIFCVGDTFTPPSTSSQYTSSGIYTDTVWSAPNCVDYILISDITFNTPPPNPFNWPEDSTICNGDTIELGPYMYLPPFENLTWDDGSHVNTRVITSTGTYWAVFDHPVVACAPLTDTINVTVLNPDSTYSTTTSCNPADTGTLTNLFTNQTGCDSLHTVYTSLLPADTTYETQTTSNPALVDTIYSVGLTNQAGCDSTHVIYIQYFASCNLDTLIIMAYNTLQFTGTPTTSRDADFRTVISAAMPDILVTEEILNQGGFDRFRDSIMYQISGNYKAGTFYDGPDMDNAIFYDSTKYSFISVTPISNSGPRDFFLYDMMHRASCTPFKIYSLHLKAGTNASDFTERATQITELRAITDALPAGTNFMVVGDFNFYGSTDQAYINLTTIGANQGYGIDPLSATMVGTWNNAAYAPYHTQSPRTTSFGGGAVGGMNDRFDIIVHSQGIENGVNNMFALTSEYNAFGNDGQHYNLAINAAPANTAVSAAVAQALHDASDHLPIMTAFGFCVSLDTIFDTTAICYGDTLSLSNGQEIFAAGTYYDTLTTTSGCDSLINLTVNVLPAPVSNYTFACSINPTDAGNDTITLLNSLACDSVYNITTTTFIDTVLNTSTMSGCDSVQFNGAWHTSNTTVIDTVQSALGCDSIYNQTNINIYPTPVSNYTYACSINPSDAGNDTTTLTNGFGCDSVYNITITTFIDTVLNTNTMNDCDSVQVNGIWYTSNTTVLDTTFSVLGCDSIYNETNVIILPDSTQTIIDSFCMGTNYVLNGGTIVTTGGTYMDTVSNTVCSTIYTYNLTTYSCLNCDVDLGQDTTFCQGGSTTLDAGIGFDEYLWSDNSTNQTLMVSTSGDYWVQTTIFDTANNLVANGDFEQGNVGFTSDYNYSTSGAVVTCSNGNQAWGITGCEGTYTVTTSPNLAHSNFAACADHTANGSNMIVVNGSNTPNMSVWCQTVSVSPNTDYIFSAWVMSVMNTTINDVSTLHFLIDGVQIGPNFSPSLTACNWQQFNTTWNSGSSTTATICIESDVISGNNDYAIDDIFFTPYCVSSDTVTVTVNPYPVVNLGADVTTCNTSVALDAITANATYNWQDNSTNATYTATSTGEYYVDVTVNNCTTSDTIEVSLNTASSGQTTAAICAGDSLFLANAWQTTSGTYYDTLVNANSCDSILATTLNVIQVQTNTPTTMTTCANELPVQIYGNNVSTAGTYYDTIQSSVGCDSVINSITLQINDTSSTTVLMSICQGDSALINGVYQSVSGTYINDTLSGTNGCDLYEYIDLTINATPIVSLGNDTSIQEGTIFTIDVLNPSSANSYTWTNSLGETYTGQSIIANENETAQYIVVATNSGNCSSEDSILITIIPNQETILAMPTAFSPNGDGLNDVFRPANYQDFESYLLRIYNRWGELIYEEEGYGASWNGKYKGEDQNVDVYTYYIEATPLNGGSILKQSGNMTIIR